MLKKLLSAMLSVVMLAASCSIGVNAEQVQQLQEPLPLEAYGLHLIQTETKNNYAVRYDENGQEIDITEYNRSVRMYSQTLPQSYDLRDEGRVTSVKSQGSLGLCWDFASTASIESSVLSTPELVGELGENAWETLDLSEAGNTWYVHTSCEDESSVLFGSTLMNDKGENGGLSEYVAFGLSSGYGAYQEKDLPYSQWSQGYTESMRYYSDYRLKEFAVLENDVDNIKQRLMEYGAVVLNYYHYGSNYYTVDGMMSYNEFGGAVEPSDSDNGHMVTLVGWDDNFSADNFHPDARPQSDGAWLCKNSWGEDSCSTADGYQGYFWISYEAYSLGFTQFQVQSTDAFDNIYQNEVASLNTINGSQSAANVFVAENDEELRQICFTNIGSSDFTVDVYKLHDNYSSPVDGECILSFDSSVNYSGTHCIECPEGIVLSEGDTFSVVITDENEFWVNYSSDPVNEYRNLGYLMDENGNWVDVADIDCVGYVCIKAYTSNKDGAVIKDELKESIEVAESFEVDNEVTQELSDQLSLNIENAKSVLNDDTATQNMVDNAKCLLNSSMEAISRQYLVINNYDDFWDFYNELSSSGFSSYRYIELNTDLDLSGIYDFIPLYSNSVFEGEFDGNNHTISGLNMDKEGTMGGLFAGLSGATIKNLTIADSYIASEGNTGAIAGYSDSCTFINCKVENTQLFSHTEYAAGISGMDIGSVFENCSVSNCEIMARNSVGIYSSLDVETTQCESDGVKLISCSEICADGNISVSYMPYTNVPLVTYVDGQCTVEDFMGKIVNVKVNGEEVECVNGKYTFEFVSGKATLDIEYEEYEESDFGYTFDLRSKEIMIRSYFGNDTKVVIPDYIGGLPVTSIIYDFDFYTEEPVVSLTISGNIKRIEGVYTDAFNSLEELIFSEGVETIGREMFANCSSLKKVSLPDSLTEIENFAFANCGKLEQIDFGSGLKSIGDCVFMGAQMLSVIELPESLEAIGANAFAECGALSVVFGSNVKDIADYSVGYTTYMRENYSFVKIPDFKIYGYSGTDAERYAIENEFEFIDITNVKPDVDFERFDYSVFEKGDVDLDGAVTIFDATLIQRHLVGAAELNGVQVHNALIVNGYGTVSVLDATNIQLYLAQITPCLGESAQG